MITINGDTVPNEEICRSSSLFTVDQQLWNALYHSNGAAHNHNNSEAHENQMLAAQSMSEVSARHLKSPRYSRRKQRPKRYS